MRGKGKEKFPNRGKPFVILCALLFSLIVIPAFANETKVTLSPINPQFQKYINLIQAKKAPKMVTAEGHYSGLIPAPLDMSHTKGISIIPKVKRVSYPTSYDLRTLGRVTSVKDQESCGSCWAFATYSSLESWLKKEGETWDFSENNLKNCHGFDYTGCEGGNEWMSTAYLVRWSGPIDEADDPYHDYEEACTLGLKGKKHVETVLFVPDRANSTDNDNIKEAVMNYGAMYTTMYYDDSYYNETYHTYYYDGSDYSNHAVAIVGWNDKFDKTLFNSPYPSDNGAWIVKNSWGTDWGESGYFYVSYYDSNIGKDNASFINAEQPDNFTIYQYDPLGVTSSCGYNSNTAWGANIFTATSNEKLISVGFYALTVNTSYNIYIYDSFSGGSFSDLLGSTSGTLTYPGYHTIDLGSPISLTSGDDFAVVVKFTTPGYNYPIPIEYPYPGYSDAATANPGESYISYNGISWTDITIISGYSNTNVCIKAIAQPRVSPEHLTGLIVYPNPFKSSKHTEIIFKGLTRDAKIRIFTLSGELVREVDVRGQFSWSWDVKNDKGEDVARGIYVYLVTNSAGEKKIGKIAIIREK